MVNTLAAWHFSGTVLSCVLQSPAGGPQGDETQSDSLVIKIVFHSLTFFHFPMILSVRAC